MTKVVYNADYGGFSISHEAVLRIAELKGVQLYPRQGKYGFWHYCTVPPEQQPKELETKDWSQMSMPERQAHNEEWEKKSVDWVRDISRTDPDLVKAVEELGKKANGAHASLEIAEIPKGSRYRIDEYDGSESVMTPEDYEWETA